MTKATLFERGVERMLAFCAANDVRPPRVEISEEPTQFATCAYYRDGVIRIWPAACAHVGRSGRAWSYPGHTIDRTPFGVVQHELGHHVDEAEGNRPGAGLWRLIENGEKPISGYAPNPNEWFAEMFRLYVTNPDLLRLLRPKTYVALACRFRPVETRSWDVVLAGAARQLAVLRKRMPRPTVGSTLFEAGE